MKYQEQLRQPEWADKRQEILKRDDFKCTTCGADKSEYEGWTVRFEEASSNELSGYGYSVESIEKMNYDTIISYGRQWVGKVDFLSKIREPFMLENVRFSERQWYNRPARLVFYYSGESRRYQLGQLNIHHKFYISGRLAWQYENEALITLCYDCHKKVHESELMKVHSPELGDGKTRYVKNCTKCEATGYLPQFSHRDNGICYPCEGRGLL